MLLLTQISGQGFYLAIYCCWLFELSPPLGLMTGALRAKEEAEMSEPQTETDRLIYKLVAY